MIHMRRLDRARDLECQVTKFLDGHDLDPFIYRVQSAGGRYGSEGRGVPGPEDRRGGRG
jgi:hypothetical protein